MNSTSISVVGLVLRRRRTILYGILGGLVVGVLLALLLPGAYAATSRFKPQNSDQNSQRLAGLAAQFGVAVGGFGSEGESADFYAELLRSEALLREATHTTYTFPEEPGSADTLRGTLVTLLKADGDTDAERSRDAVDRLRDRVNSSVGPKSGLVLLRVETPWAALSEQVSRRLLDLTSEFNLETRQSTAAAERAFVEQRLEEVEGELAEAEAAHRRFLEQNRRYSESPELRFEEARLARRVSLHQEVYTSLAQSYEQARIEEVRNTPVITVIDPPEQSVRPAGAGPAFRLAASLLVGLMVGLLVAFLQEYLRAQRELAPQQFDELRQSVAAARDELRPSRVFRRAQPK